MCGYWGIKKTDEKIIRDDIFGMLEKYCTVIYYPLGKAYEPKHIRKIAKRASSRLVYQKITKQQNIEAVVDNTYEELEHAENVSSESVNSDWMFRFLNS